MKLIDNFLNSITMYRLVLYGLLAMLIFSVVIGLFGLLPWTSLQLLISAATLTITCLATNFIFSKILRAATNQESALITALILYFVLSPVAQITDFYALVLGGTIAMASKYIFAIHKKHIFNPAALGALILGIFGVDAAIWWIATPVMLPLTLIVGILLVHKIRRFHLFLSYFSVSFILTMISLMMNKTNFISALGMSLTSWPLIFFGTIMVTEPLTSPPNRMLRMMYGALVGLVSATQFHIGPLFTSPELALIVGNIFSYIVSPKAKLTLALDEKNELTSDTYEFVFTPDKKLNFKPGQYVEWTLPHKKIDGRGNRRYFTLASSPSENKIRLGVRINPNRSSSFKKRLQELKKGDTLMIANLTGDFTMPEDKNKKLAFVAGGIGVTPFRSMVQYLMDNNEKRDIVLFYNAAKVDCFAYKNLFDQASRNIGLKIHYILTSDPGSTWKGKTGYITAAMIQEEVPDYQERHFYLSGPNAMVQNYKTMLLKLGISRKNISTDYFPGF